MTVYRRLLPGEGWRYRAHLLRLNPEDRRARFMGGLSTDAVDAYGRGIDWSHALVIAAIVRGEVRAAVELRWEGRRGELAVSVEREWQGLGLGTALTRRLLLMARNRGVRHLCMVCLPENRRMQRIARRLLGPCRFEDGEVTSDVTLPGPTPLTMALEALDAGAVPWSAALDHWQGDLAHAA